MNFERKIDGNIKRQKMAALFATFAISVGFTGCHAGRMEIAPPGEGLSIATNIDIVKVSKNDVLRSLGSLAIKGVAPKTGYSREQFGGDWTEDNKCDTRDRILKRDLTKEIVDENCEVVRGKLDDPYTGKKGITFVKGTKTSSLVQIDHVVALSDAWQKGAAQMDPAERVQFANDGLNLLAVSGAANGAKKDGDAATWLPANREVWCDYVARQTLVKDRYDLWITQAEHDKIEDIVEDCPDKEFALAQ